MKNEIKKVPDIRFKGFIDDWEQRKFGYVFTEYSDKGHEQFPALTIIQGHGTITRDESDRNMIYDKNGLRNYKLVNKSDFIVHLRSFEGGFEIANSQGIVSPAYHVFHGEDANSRFYYPYFRSFNFINAKLKPFVYGIRDGRSIDIQGMKKALIPYPSYEEQTKIGNLLTKIDSIITLHQRKLKQLQTLKKYFLQNMFPAKEEKVPEIRFKGFTDDWEQRKLGEISGSTYGGGTPKISEMEYWNGKIPWIQSSNLVENELFSVDIQRFVTELGICKSAVQLVPKNAIAVVSHVGVGKLVFMPVSYTTSQDFISLANLKSEPKFTCYAIYKQLQKELHIVQGSAIKGITKDDLLNKKIEIPTYKEQKKISNFLLKIDSIITLHQRKCDQLQSFKKFMLQNLFI